MAKLQIKNLSKTFGNSKILDSVDISVKDGEFIILVGPSGSGKSTILRLISGLDSPSSGNIYIDEKDVTTLLPKNRDIAMVFQNYALYPHMTIYENLAFPLKIKNIDKTIIESTVNEVSEMLGIKKYLSKKPKELSGGERQRVALGRAIIRKPKIFLMDEPLSNLDAKLRTQMRAELLRLHKSLSNTIIYVTHDQIEALTMGDRIVVLNQGKIQQIGTPQEVYNTPNNIFVASFIGSPSINLLDFKIIDLNNIVLNGKPFKFSTPQDTYSGLMSKYLINKDLILGARPENLNIKSTSSLMLSGKIELIEMLGNEYLLYVRLDDTFSKRSLISVRLHGHCSYLRGNEITLYLDVSSSHLFNSMDTQRITI
jgi:multiple sugar transport system ATP-binding protein